MKKLVALLSLGAAAVVGLTAASEAAFTPLVAVRSTATATVGGTPTVNFSVAIRSAATPLNNVAASRINWTSAVAGTTQWQIADQVLLLHSTVTTLNAGIRIYTDNKSAVAIPQFVDPTPTISTNTDSNPAGLVWQVPGLSTSSKVLPMAWTIKASTQAVNTTLQASDPNNGPASGPAWKGQWLFVKDKGQTTDIPDLNATAFVDGEEFTTILRQSGNRTSGLHFGQGPEEFGPDGDGSPAFVYFEADFSTALPGQTYQTTTLTIESFTQ